MFMFDLFDKMMWSFVVEDIAQELLYLPYAILPGLLLYGILRAASPDKNKKISQCIKAVLLIYLVALAHITLWEREPGSRTGVSLILFETMGGSRSNAYVMENVLLFIPFGFLAAAVSRPMRSLLLSLLTGALSSLMIETIQLITQRGHFQVDDILTNSIGAGIGCLCYWLVISVYRGFRRLIMNGTGSAES